MSEQFTLQYSAATVQHLGIGLYKQLPQALAELITNSWDADSTKVDIYIDYNERIIKVSDNGNGMTFNELNKNFLTIAKNRRNNDNKGLSPKGRKVTGKKGLGKLALFGIANIIEVSSIKNNLLNSFELNYLTIKDTPDNNQYHPKALKIKQQVKQNHGTTIIIKDITLKTISKLDDLYLSLSKRFNKYSKDKFYVSLSDNYGNKKSLDENAFVNSIKPKSDVIEFTYKFPEDYEIDENNNRQKIFKDLKSKNVKGFIYTKKTPLRSTEQGFSVLSRGKLASEQSTTQFQDRANDLFYDYAVGYFDIDFLDDDIKNDYISTDRQSIRWEASDDLLHLKENLNGLMNITQAKWRKDRQNAKKKKITKTQNNNPIIKNLSEDSSFNKTDKKGLDNIIAILENDNVTITEIDKQNILENYTKNTVSYKKDNSVYKELIPSNFIVPKTVGNKIRMLREEMIEAADDKDQNKFILTQGLLLRAMIDSTTTTLLRKYWQQLNSDNLININGSARTIEKESDVDQLPFQTKYETMIRLLVKLGKIDNRRKESLIKLFDHNKITKHLDTLMHDSQNFPQFESLKIAWNTVSPQLLLAFNLIKTDE